MIRNRGHLHAGYVNAHPSGYVKGCQCQRCAAYRQRARDRARAKAAAAPSINSCQRCGSAFAGRRRKYCSDECKNKAHREQKTAAQRRYARNYTPEQKEQRRARDRERNKARAGTRKSWEWNLKHVHGMTPSDWHAMFTDQRGLCYLGGHPLPDDRKKIAVDHDHTHCPKGRSCAICRRGLACSNCNTLIGYALDDPQLLRTIADNLERQSVVTKMLIMAAPQQGVLDLMFADPVIPAIAAQLQ